MVAIKVNDLHLLIYYLAGNNFLHKHSWRHECFFKRIFKNSRLAFIVFLKVFVSFTRVFFYSSGRLNIFITFLACVILCDI